MTMTAAAPTLLDRAQEQFKRHVRMPIFRLRHPRAFHGFCIGTSKSGTHSVWNLLHRPFRAGHELESEESIRLILARAEGKASESDEIRFLRERDTQRFLEMDSSNVNIHFVERLVEMFPEAKFILTIRECLSWVDSEINHKLNHPPPPAWPEFWDHRYQAAALTFPPEERLLQEHGLHTLEGYLSYWAWHNGMALTAIPPERLLVIKTRELSASTPKIADFLGFDHARLNRGSHDFAAPRKFHMLEKLDQEYVRQKALAHCGKVMRQVFPEAT